MKITFPFVLVAALFIQSVVAKPLETLVVTGQHLPRPQSQLVSTTSVIDRDAIVSLNYRNAADLLRAIPGVLVNQEGGAGGTISISLRGGEPNFTVVMIDGVPVNDPTNTRGGSFDLSTVSVSTIERIEIVRGPQSAIYGSGALSGVINIITRREQPETRQQLMVAAEEHGGEVFGYRGQWASDSAGLQLGLGKRQSAELVKGSHLNQQEASLGFYLESGQAFELSGGLRWQEADKTSYPEQSGGPELAQSSDLDRVDNRDLTAYLQWDVALTSWWFSQLRADDYDHELDFNSPGIAPYNNVPPNGYEAEYEHRQYRWLNRFEIARGVAFTLGADRRKEKGDSTGYVTFPEIPPEALAFLLGLPEPPVDSPLGVPISFTLDTRFELERDIDGLFADLTYDTEWGLLLQASLRRDRPDTSDKELTRKVGARYTFADGRWSVSVNWGEGFKLPSFFALGHSLTGNPDLKPETATSADVSVAWQPSPSLSATVTAFENRFENLIDFDADSFTNVNRSRVDTQGGELEASWSITTALDLKAHATYTDIDVNDSNRKLAGRPQWKRGWLLDWNFAPRWQVSLHHQWQDETYATSLHTGETTEHTLDSYHRLDVALNWRAFGQLDVVLAAHNLTDEVYEEAVGFPGAGRYGSLALRYQF